MVRALEGDAVPNLLIMQYDTAWIVRNLLLIPSFFFSLAAVERRKPLSPTARRAGWVGCNIRLDAIAEPGKLFLISSGRIAVPGDVRRQYQKVRPLANLKVNVRGWTLDVLRLLQQMGRKQFTTAEAYALEGELSRLYPGNHNVRPKIRQQLQLLRDMRLLRFEARGVYSLP
jgi:type II restriction enzyme